MKRYFIFIVFFFCIAFARAQELTITVENRPLNEVLITLRDQYGLQFSFNDNHLAQYQVTVSQTFSNPEDALGFLLKELPLVFKKSGEVYVVFSREPATAPTKYVLSGTLYDNSSGGPLPYVHLMFNDQGMVSNQNGQFSYLASNDSMVHMKASYLGFYILDTLLFPGTWLSIGLSPSVMGLEEVVITGKPIEYGIQAGKTPGTLRLNHQVARHLPGNGDNSIFNLLRLQPGILAAGEHTNDLIIRGSDAGQSQVLFDGFTVFGLKNFNDNISAINPYMVKDIQIMKSGYDARYGERIGGIVNITGADGSLAAPQLKVNLNNMTVNGYGSLPLFKRTALSVAFRKTYYDLYKDKTFSTTDQRRGHLRQRADIYLAPEYDFYDLNAKYSGSFSNGDNFYLSMFRASDKFSYDFVQRLDMNQIKSNTTENSGQLGGAVYYNKLWKNGNNSALYAGYSAMGKALHRKQQIRRVSGPFVYHDLDNLSYNSIGELSSTWSNRTRLGQRHLLETSLGLIQNSYSYRKDTFDIVVVDETRKSGRTVGYIQDNLNAGKLLDIKYGIRFDYLANMRKWYWQPRISAIYRPFDHYTISAAWGHYNQFITKNALTDRVGNIRYLWLMADGNKAPVLSAWHHVLGLSRHNNGVTISVEGYFTKSDGLSRIMKEPDGSQKMYYGNSISKGVDIYVKKELDHHTLWASYTLANTLEHFNYFNTETYAPARFDQRHELKLAGIFSLGRFYLSANYVYGSGFPEAYLPVDLTDNPAGNYYSRLDGALTYKLLSRRIHIEGGVSVLNIFNRENIKYDNFLRIPVLDNSNTITVHAEAVPFTPAIFLNLEF